MASLNKVIALGNLTRDPQFKYLPNNTGVCEFGIAMNRKFKSGEGEEREEVCFVDCTAFGKTGEVINQHFTKGKQILIEGRLKYDTWEDKQGGGKRSKLSVVVETFQFIGPRDDGDGDSREQTRQQTRPQGRQANTQQNRSAPQRTQGSQRQPQRQDQPFGDERQFKEDDIPF